MKTNSIFAVAFAALVTFASCSKEENNKNLKDGEKTRVVLNVEKASQLTRGIGQAMGAKPVEFLDGYVVFANSNNIATDVFRIVSGTPGEGEVNMSGEVDFEEVSGESRNIYILGNVGTQTITAGTTNMETFVAQANITAKSQTDDVDASTVKAVSLYGKTSSTIDHTQNPSTATVHVAPISSRLEIAQFTAGGEVSGYKIEGIFINNFYNTITYKGTLNTVSGNDKFYLAKEDVADFTAGGGSAYSVADAGYFYNEDKTNGLAPLNGLVCKPASGIWAYNVPAPTSGEFPHIVIRVSGVTGIAELLPTETRWMTVTKFIYDGGPNDGDDVPAFEAGKIYNITDFTFDETNLDVDPEMKTISAKVTVTLAEWEPISVKPW